MDTWFKNNFGRGLNGNPDDFGQLNLAIGAGPDGRPAIQQTFLASDNKKSNWGTATTAIQKANHLGMKTVRISMEIWIEDSLDFDNTGIKIYGMSGGGKVGAGNTYQPMEQDGWYSWPSLANLNNTDAIYLGNYNYYLNRAPKPDASGRYWGGTAYGKANFPVPKGKWVRHEYEVHLNTPGRTDGYARLWLDGRLLID